MGLNLEEFDKHFGEGKEYTFYDGDKVFIMELKALRAEHLVKYIYLQDKMPQIKQGETPEEYQARLKKEDYEIFADAIDLMRVMLYDSHPELKEKKESTERFIFKHYGLLLEALHELQTDKDPETVSKEKVKQFVEDKREKRETESKQRDSK